MNCYGLLLIVPLPHAVGNVSLVVLEVLVKIVRIDGAIDVRTRNKGS